MPDPMLSYRPKPEVSDMIREYAHENRITLRAATDELVTDAFTRWRNEQYEEITHG